jgi:hypothetical protein
MKVFVVRIQIAYSLHEIPTFVVSLVRKIVVTGESSGVNSVRKETFYS